MPPKNIINIQSGDDLEKIEEDIIEAAEKAGKKNVIVNIFTAPHRALCRRWHVRYKFNKKHLIMDLAIAAGVLFLIGLNIFWWYGGFHYFTDKFDLAVDAHITGQEAVFSVNYTNDNKFALEDVVLSLKLPKHFELKSTSRTDFDEQHKTIQLGNLSPGANGKLEISGIIFGEIGIPEQFVVLAAYYKTDKRGERLWGQFNKSQFFRYEPFANFSGGSPFSFNAAWPDALVSGQTVELAFDLINQSNVSFSDVKIVPHFDKQIIEIAEKEFAEKEWPAGATQNYKWYFRLDTEEPNKNLSIAVYLFYNNEWLKQGEWAREVEVLRPRFSVEQELLTDEGALNPGQSAAIAVSYKNDGEYTIESAEVSLELSGDYWDISAIEASGGRIEGNKVIWSIKEWPQLALIQPNEKNEKEIRIGIKEYVAGSSDFNVKSRMNVQYRLEGQTVEITGPWLETKLNSNLSLLAYPMYFTKSGDQLGRGPLPLKIGEETKYWIFVKVINDINDVEKTKVVAVLPPNVVSTGKTNVPVGDPIQFDEASQTVSWQISKMPAKAENIGFAFEVGIIPTAEQKGTYPALISELAVFGTDKTTGKFIEKNLGAITAQLNYDEIGKKKDGKVK